MRLEDGLTSSPRSRKACAQGDATRGSEEDRKVRPQWTPSIRPVMDMSNPASCERCQKLQIEASAGLSPRSEALRLAGSQVSTTGRFWVSTEGQGRVSSTFQTPRPPSRKNSVPGVLRTGIPLRIAIQFRAPKAIRSPKSNVQTRPQGRRTARRQGRGLRLSDQHGAIVAGGSGPAPESADEPAKGPLESFRSVPSSYHLPGLSVRFRHGL